jgi:hypothetical protein
MIRERICRALDFLGFDLRQMLGIRDISQGFVLYRYVKKDGTFDYDKYRQIQEEGNKAKINNVWAREENISFLAQYMLSLGLKPQFGICHGTRRGREQEWFRKYLSCDVLGTEISETAINFPNTIQWDFHEVKPEWIDAADFIYSNSFDHSYDPEKCLNAWMSCVKKNGLCIIEHSSEHEPRGASRLDPFGADVIQMPYLITTWGAGRYFVRQLLASPFKSDRIDHLTFIVIQRA